VPHVAEQRLFETRGQRALFGGINRRVSSATHETQKRGQFLRGRTTRNSGFRQETRDTIVKQQFQKRR
jgi:hypothetical protein